MKKDKPPKKGGKTLFAIALEKHGIKPKRAAEIMGVGVATINGYCTEGHRLSIYKAEFHRIIKLVTETPITISEISEIRKSSDPQTTMEDDDLDGLESAASRIEKRIAGLFDGIEELQGGLREIRAQQRKTQEHVMNLQAEQQKTQERVTNLAERVARLEDDEPSPQGRKRRA